MKYSEAVLKLKDIPYADFVLAPAGKVTTREQYDYIKYYAEHTEIDDRYIKSFEDVCGKWIDIGSWFGGAAFYFSVSNGKPTDEGFSFGDLGKIEFDKLVK